MLVLSTCQSPNRRHETAEGKGISLQVQLRIVQTATYHWQEKEINTAVSIAFDGSN